MLLVHFVTSSIYSGCRSLYDDWVLLRHSWFDPLPDLRIIMRKFAFYVTLAAYNGHVRKKPAIACLNE
jgi:hypothetical protein